MSVQAEIHGFRLENPKPQALNPEGLNPKHNNPKNLKGQMESLLKLGASRLTVQSPKLQLCSDLNLCASLGLEVYCALVGDQGGE